ncbi:MAG: tetratricopeptide repeat protein [Candidatus Competibacterales bacterium]|nr:tetratricopeptide repeat protein [Candidatus Competibacterales bacterium]
MAEHLSDEEKVEAIKQWLQTNGPGIAAGILIGLAGIGGWQWWQNRQQAIAEAASGHYDTLLSAVEADDAPRARGQAAVLTDTYADTTYGALAGLMLARLDAADGANEQAIEWLRWVLQHTDRRDLRDIARLRLARLLLAEDRLDEAQAQLDQILSAAYSAEQEELRGDIHLARNDIERARSAYQAALAAQGSAGGDGQLLRWKLNSLPAATGS